VSEEWLAGLRDFFMVGFDRWISNGRAKHGWVFFAGKYDSESGGFVQSGDNEFFDSAQRANPGLAPLAAAHPIIDGDGEYFTASSTESLLTD